MRVIAGALRGRSLVAPKGHGTRPTSDRVREALFNVLGDVSGAVVLDLYAGTGALGIEALSRGAARAVFVENARPALAPLRRNLETLGLNASSTVVASPVLRAVRGLSSQGPFDLVLVDPPYADLAEAAIALELAAAGGLCADDARVVLEHASRDPAPAVKAFVWQATRRYGDTSLSFYLVGAARPDDASAADDLHEGVREDVSSGGADG
ncbi:MAG: 16S rRNA (guanine(966)-N(2))-methyltransferase RsmD [Polyangiaceae bacterium]|nr:16S rRNA (guanine(966)-N(2))-methyltransferase RsmD [Polyangiaceae bacterium]